MADRIKNSGPDGDGYYTDEKVALGQRRLSIIDIERWQATNVYRR